MGFFVTTTTTTTTSTRRTTTTTTTTTTTSLLLLLLVASSSILCSATTSHSVRFLQDSTNNEDENDTEVTCELVDAQWLARLLAGHQNFVRDLLTNKKNDSRRQRRQRRKRQRQRQRYLQNDATTVLLASVPPSLDSDNNIGGNDDDDNNDNAGSSSSSSSSMAHFLSHSTSDRFNLQVSTAQGNQSSVLTQVKTQYRIMPDNNGNKYDDKDKDKDVVMASTLMADQTPSVQEFVATANFWGIAISGKFSKANGKNNRYQALVVGMDSNDNDNDNASSSSSSIFLHVDKRSSVKSMKRAKRQVLMTEEDPEEFKAKNVACLDSSFEMNAPCRKGVLREYRDAEAILKEPFQASLQVLDHQVAQLDPQRFQDLYVIAAQCATLVTGGGGDSSSSSDTKLWDANAVMDCINEEKFRFYESFLVGFGILRNEIQSETVTRNLEVEKLKLGRNANLRAACCGVEEDDEDEDDNDDNNRRRRRLWNEKRLFMPAVDSTPWWTTMTTRRWWDRTMPEEQPHHHQQSRLSSFSRKRTLAATVMNFPGPVTHQDQERRLQSASAAAASTCQFLVQVDEQQVDTLTEFPQDLYRSLTESANDDSATTSVPSDAYVTKGYNTADTNAQELNFQKDSFSVEVRQATVVQLDVTALVKRKNDAPKQVRRYVKNGEFEAVLVEGSQTQSDGSTEIEFVGVIFSRTDKKKQLMWPVDSGSLQVFLARRRRRLARRRQGRFLQTVDSEAGTVTCTSAATLLLLNDLCVTEAQEQFNELQSTALQEQDLALQAIDQEIANVTLERLDNVRFAGAECAAALGGWNVTLLGTCLQDEKIPEITREYLTSLLEWNNEAVRVAIDTSQAIAQGRLERDNALAACCEEITAPPSSLVPTASLFQNPTQAPTPSPTRDPTTRPTTASPTVAPTTTTPSATPTTVKPSAKPSNPPSPKPGNPTMAPVVAPSRGPTVVPSAAPFHSPTVVPSAAPVSTLVPTTQLPPTSFPTTSRPSTTMPTTAAPSVAPTKNPSMRPSTTFPSSAGPTVRPTTFPSNRPTTSPSNRPTTSPSNRPTTSPSVLPTTFPSNRPTPAPFVSPTTSPFVGPTTGPSVRPTALPTTVPSSRPTTSPSSPPTTSPSSRPTVSPTTASPSRPPTSSPSRAPTLSPIDAPTRSPSRSPSNSPTSSPTKSPTTSPTTSPTHGPTSSPTTSPTSRPTSSPTNSPTDQPTLNPTNSPSDRPTLSPTNSPSDRPTLSPTNSPTSRPTLSPTNSPIHAPTRAPTGVPTKRPSTTAIPTSSPSAAPTRCSVVGQTNLDFEGFSNGQLLGSTDITGVTVKAYRPGGNPATAPLVLQANLNLVLVVPNSDNTSLNSAGGRLEFDFTKPGVVPVSFFYVGGGSGGTVTFVDSEGGTLHTQSLPTTGDANQVVSFAGVSLSKFVRLIQFDFVGQGGADNVTFDRVECS